MSAQSGMQTSTGPAVEVAEVDDAITEATQPELAAQGKRFFFGNITLFTLPDKSVYHVKRQHALITDPKIIDGLLALAKDPFNKIFPQE